MSKTTDKSNENSQQNGLPLFFKRPVPMDVSRHAEAGLSSKENFAFARGTNSIFINTIEFAEAAKHYPIVFSTGDNPMPAVLTGLESSNYYVGKDNLWKKDAYIPAYVRRYPFVFMEVPDQDKFVLCIDEESDHFQNKLGKQGNALYENGKPSQLSLNALEFCKAFQQEFMATRQFSEALKEEGLLSPTRSDAKLQNGREMQLAGFQIIDEGKFSKLPDETILKFHKKGWLPLIYFVLMSASNWRNLIQQADEAEKLSA